MKRCFKRLATQTGYIQHDNFERMSPLLVMTPQCHKQQVSVLANIKMRKQQA